MPDAHVEYPGRWFQNVTKPEDVRSAYRSHHCRSNEFRLLGELRFSGTAEGSFKKQRHRSAARGKAAEAGGLADRLAGGTWDELFFFLRIG